ncbi:MAG: hypothetical protein ACHQF0_16930 [Chitinophagales bacterium]
MKIHLRTSLLCCSLLVLISSCKKLIESAINHGLNAPKKGELVEYTIPKGQHYTDQNTYQAVSYDELKFTVKFDSSAVYQTIDPVNQEDINKLYGFSDNNADHQQFSARFGWNWARGALRLYAYVYNSGERASQEITSIQIGTEYTCSIKVSGDHYIFSADNITIEMPRESKTSGASGYKLFPYFGGDETAPHEIDIWIKEL